MRLHLLLPSALVFGALLGCKHDVDTAPACYSGTVLYGSCIDGFLVQVDEQYAIGQTLPAASAPGGTDLPNVIAAVNALPDSVGKPGQRFYFTYQNDPKRQAPYYCYVNRPPLPVPHLVLSNVATTPCAPLVP
ncbi:hypothetical protein ACFQ48_12100 [Hymenobacter caeli]|uniref:Lipoprotein n=1 Tax=Hymenobacter caeli TaxID=2735894 RepID=A0ABX2FPF8_9BACT|nr:hypothetical protein [Hymenobacter caeli]NRT18426.1 hypothetical protein [Hymenobacter caeli]